MAQKYARVVPSRRARIRAGADVMEAQAHVARACVRTAVGVAAARPVVEPLARSHRNHRPLLRRAHPPNLEHRPLLRVEASGFGSVRVHTRIIAVCIASDFRLCVCICKMGARALFKWEGMICKEDKSARGREGWCVCGVCVCVGLGGGHAAFVKI